VDERGWRIAVIRPDGTSAPGWPRGAPVGSSVAIDGVSLTINEVGPTEFSVNLIPHTQAVTTLGEFKPGRRVNLEVDQVARYVERLLDPQVAR